MKNIQLIGLDNIPEISAGDDIGQMVIDCADYLENEDVIVIAQKIISKAEGRYLNIKQLQPSVAAIELAQKTGRSPEFCEAILMESNKVIETKGRIIVVEHKNGMICTSAGIDMSNINTNEGSQVILLPLDSDLSAKKIREEIEQKIKKNIAIIISDSMGNPNREGSIGQAIGFSGIKGIVNKEEVDLYKNKSKPQINLVDQIASAASLIMGESNEGMPIVIVRGLEYSRDLDSKLTDILITKK
jgi:coenzyme F420-0:L-glutamate ligase/coenzyme F420-1:gamma-L-glutamate ligase